MYVLEIDPQKVFQEGSENKPIRQLQERNGTINCIVREGIERQQLLVMLWLLSSCTWRSVSLDG
jgi:hypothetical protein